MKSQEEAKREKFRKIKDLILEIGSTVDTAVVDGVHDQKTLKHMGFEAPVFTRSELPYIDLADLIAKKFKTVVILTDFDEEGENANRTLSRLLEQKQIKVCRSCRENLEVLLKQEKISTIEGIYGLIAK